MANKRLCPFCHNEIDIEATRCKYCQKWLDENISEPKKFIDTLILSLFVGVYGIHRFFTGYYAIGIIQLLTFGGCGIWSSIDFISICLGKYKDANNYELEKYNRKSGLIILSLVIVLYLIIVMLILGLIMLAIHLGSKG